MLMPSSYRFCSGSLPIFIAALTGSRASWCLSGALTMDEAYRNVEWRAVFLIAGMLPMGIALEKTGAAQSADGAGGQSRGSATWARWR